ncbi:Transthyretin-like family protein [Cooperia oncophora]
MKLLLSIAATALLQQGHCDMDLSSRFLEFQQSLAITGQLDCNGSPVAGAQVELRDSDEKGEKTTLAKSTSLKSGRFYVFGFKPGAAPTMDPELVIHYTCHAKKEDNWPQRAVITKMQSFVRKGLQPVPLFNMGLIKLADLSKLHHTY